MHGGCDGVHLEGAGKCTEEDAGGGEGEVDVGVSRRRGRECGDHVEELVDELEGGI